MQTDDSPGFIKNQGLTYRTPSNHGGNSAFSGGSSFMPTSVDDKEDSALESQSSDGGEDGPSLGGTGEPGGSDEGSDDKDDKDNRILNFSGGVPIKGNDFSWHDRTPDDQNYSVGDDIDPAGVQIMEAFKEPSESPDYVLLGSRPQRIMDRVAPIEAFSNKANFLGSFSIKPHLHEGGVLVEPFKTRDTSKGNKEWTGGVTVPNAHAAIMALGMLGGLRSKYNLGKDIEDPEVGYGDLADFKNKMQNRTISILASGQNPRFGENFNSSLPKLISIHLGTNESPLAISFHTPISLINPALNHVLGIHPHSKSTHYATGEARFFHKDSHLPASISDTKINSHVLKSLMSLDLAPFRKANPHLESSHTFSVMYPSVNIQKMATPDAFKGYFHTDTPQDENMYSGSSEGSSGRGFTRSIGLEQIPNVTSIKNLVKLVKAHI